MKRNCIPAVTWTIPFVFCVLYALWPYMGWPTLHYAPEDRQIFLAKPENVILMGWYGRTVMAAIYAIVAGILFALVVPRLPSSIQKSGPWLAAAAALFAMIVTAVHEIHRWMT